MSFIYTVTNNESGKMYVGLTNNRDPELRWKQHQWASRNPKEKSNQLHWDIHYIGAEHFTFAVIEECSYTDKEDREKYWIEHYNCVEEGYNRTVKSGDQKYKKVRKRY